MGVAREAGWDAMSGVSVTRDRPGWDDRDSASMSGLSVTRDVAALPMARGAVRETLGMQGAFKKIKPPYKGRMPIVPDHVVTGFNEPKGPSPRRFTDVHRNYLGHHEPNPQGLRPPQPNAHRRPRLHELRT